MHKTVIAGVVVVAIILIGVLYFVNKAEVVAADMVVEGDYAPEALVLKDGATLTVKGNLVLENTLSCDGGGIMVVVEGSAAINGAMRCEGEQGDIVLVAKGGLVMSPRAEVVAGGNVQFVSSEEYLLKTQADIDAKFVEVGTDSGSGVRVGPLVAGEELVLIPSVLSGEKTSFNLFDLLAPAVAHAQAPAPVVIAGVMRVATPPLGVKRLVVLAFPDAEEVSIADFELTGPDGRKGEDDKGANCSAKGKNGEDAFRFSAQAPNLKVNNFTLNLGSGGVGGSAETPKACAPGRAEGGRGGESGNFKMTGAESFSIEGAFLINPGTGGAGGGALAQGKDGDAGATGGDATAVGGRGADNKKTIRVQGAVAGMSNVHVGDLVAGGGGWASAEPGKGGDGNVCGMAGGAGGKGVATGGRGGDARMTLGGGATRAGLANDIGGAGGGVDTAGGAGGTGGSCGADKTGGKGGAGGSATATEGKGGSGKNGNASDGANLAEDGGAGGAGGAGCLPGVGGKGGAGDPAGTDGPKGKNLCVPEEDQQTGVVPGGGEAPIKVIRYQNDYIPVSQLRVGPAHPPHATGSGCPQEHWHADRAAVSVSGKSFNDPNSGGCGFGTLAENPATDYTPR